mmetsp:Transcript_55527/g.146441  ORF Transcript_55527/g.146441 Transcript_55527/m.146441 type:complete len:123 (-) Transcript_55527:547-915(-)
MTRYYLFFVLCSVTLSNLQGFGGAAIDLLICLVIFCFLYYDQSNEDNWFGDWFNAALSTRIGRFVSSSFLSGSPLALVVSVAMAWLCVAWSNAKNRYFHYFTVVFFEIVVLVQSGNFSCVNA